MITVFNLKNTLKSEWSVCVFGKKPHPASQKQTGAVSSGVVRQSYCNAIFWQLMGVGSTHNHVSLDPGIGDLMEHTQIQHRQD